MAAKKTPVNKSEFIRSLPSTLSAAEVVAKAKADGIKIAPVLVYKVRGRTKAKKAGGTKSAPTKSRGTSKASFVRAHGELTAKEVVSKAKAEGIRLTEGYVYNVRTYDKKAGHRNGTGRSVGRPPGIPKAVASSSSAESLLKAVAAEIGLGRAIDIIQGERSKVRAAIGA